jgi:hypothetical protein
MLIERNSQKSLNEKSWIPCPHCEALHEGVKWSKQNGTAFKNWFGFYCDNCGQIIPCLTNLITCIILVFTFPIWFWFKDKWKAKWLEEQKVKFSKPLDLKYPKFKIKWWRAGLGWGLFMYISMSILFPLIRGGSLTQKELLLGIPVWAIGGLVFGLLTKRIYRKKKMETQTGEKNFIDRNYIEDTEVTECLR